MSITDELREYVIDADGMGMTHGHAKCIYAIADRIDAAHRSALEKLAAQLDTTNDMREFCGRIEQAATNRDDVQLWGVDYTPLPVDADGVPIHVGDVMENIVCPSVHREATGVGVECFYGWDEDNARYSQFGAVCYRHHRAPTVEDVLREFARELDADAYGITDAKVAEYAAKLRLVGEGE